MNLELPLVDYNGQPILTEEIDIGPVNYPPQQSTTREDTRQKIREKAGLTGDTQ